MTPSIDDRAINTLRMLALDAVQKANSGHPGTPMGFASPAYVLWSEFLRFNPKDPAWPNRDRFVLSAGHASMLLYGFLHLFGYGLELDDLRNFRQWGSRTPGHPEYGHTVGVETTTGPLGQGFANAVGMAMALRYAGGHFNRPGFPILDPRVFVVAGDGDMMEGISNEAASLAGHQGLSNLICLYDDNHISIDGSTSLAFTETVGDRFLALNWSVRYVEDGNDREEVRAALAWATDPELQMEGEPGTPKMIVVRTHIGFGSPKYQDTAHAHGSALGAEEVLNTKRNLGWPEEPDFFVPADVRTHFEGLAREKARAQTIWQDILKKYGEAHPDLLALWQKWMSGEALAGPVLEKYPPYPADPKGLATRQAFGEALQTASKELPGLWGGSADLAPSNNTLIKGEVDCQKGTPQGKNLHFGVREHAMAGVLNGMALTGMVRPYGGTFLVFSDYMRGSMRLAALMHQPVLFVLTHDSIGLGEDGPTHQPVEHLPGLRAIPGMTVYRPGDANETVQALSVILAERTGPSCLVLTRQKVPTLPLSADIVRKGVETGAYVVRDTGENPRLVLLASGSELGLLWEVQERLLSRNIPVRLVSVPSTNRLNRQPREVRDRILLPGLSRVLVEAAHPMGWYPYARPEDLVIGMETFGASAPAERLMEAFGFTPEAVLARIGERWPGESFR
ncbi:MAG: transketolase [Nitrospirae bacterium]|jgi:transketolase|nr:transketolase [Nitrospirota bacterium]